MNKGFLEGEAKLFVGDEPLVVNAEPTSLEFRIPDDKPLGYVLGVDKGSEEGDNGALSVWDKHNGTIEVSFTLKDSDNALGRWWKQMREQFKRDYKTMLYAVTHSYVVHVMCQDKDGTDGYFILTKPSEVRMLYRKVHFIPRFKIYDRNGYPYKIRKGVIRPFETWPLSNKQLEAYSKILESYKV